MDNTLYASKARLSPEILHNVLRCFDRVDISENGMDVITIEPDPLKFGMAEIIKVRMRINDWNLFRHNHLPLLSNAGTLFPASTDRTAAKFKTAFTLECYTLTTGVSISTLL
ncbi:MAG: hypothetical protein JW384_01944 [Nitrosomonadaceae bacterium]|nr:hypothetical protein [Nitrosomonadaceae bacterium]